MLALFHPLRVFLGQDDFIGGAVILMKDVLKGGRDEVADKWQPFELALTAGGQPAGVLKFEMMISWAPK